MTFEEWMQGTGPTTFECAFKAGAASRDAEIADLTKQRDELEFSWAGCSQQLKDACADLNAVEKERDELRAETERLQEELENEQARGIHTCRPGCTRDGCVNRRLRAELAAAIAACKVKDGAAAALLKALDGWPLDKAAEAQREALAEALSIQPDDSALKAWLGEPVVEVDDSGVVIVCRYDYKPKDKFYSPKGLK